MSWSSINRLLLVVSNWAELRGGASCAVHSLILHVGCGHNLLPFFFFLELDASSVLNVRLHALTLKYWLYQLKRGCERREVWHCVQPLRQKSISWPLLDHDVPWLAQNCRNFEPTNILHKLPSVLLCLQLIVSTALRIYNRSGIPVGPRATVAQPLKRLCWIHHLRFIGSLTG